MDNKAGFIVIQKSLRFGYFCPNLERAGDLMGVTGRTISNRLVRGGGYYEDYKWVLCKGSYIKALPRGRSGFKFQSKDY